MDKAKLKLVFLGVASAVSTVAPAILLLGTGPKAGTDECALSPDDISTVQGLLASRNASCAFNITLDEILEM